MWDVVPMCVPPVHSYRSSASPRGHGAGNGDPLCSGAQWEPPAAPGAARWCGDPIMHHPHPATRQWGTPPAPRTPPSPGLPCSTRAPRVGEWDPPLPVAGAL